jgi:hypothetical protein
MKTRQILAVKRRAMKARLAGNIPMALYLEAWVDRSVALMKPAQKQRCEDALTELEGEGL